MDSQDEDTEERNKKNIPTVRESDILVETMKKETANFMQKSQKIRDNAKETSFKYEVKMFAKKDGNSKSLSKINIDCKEMHENMIAQRKGIDQTRHRVLH